MADLSQPPMESAVGRPRRLHLMTRLLVVNWRRSCGVSLGNQLRQRTRSVMSPLIGRNNPFRGWLTLRSHLARHQQPMTLTLRLLAGKPLRFCGATPGDPQHHQRRTPRLSRLPPGITIRVGCAAMERSRVGVELQIMALETSAGQADAPVGTFTAIESESNYSCGLRSDGTITCWGGNYRPGT